MPSINSKKYYVSDQRPLACRRKCDVSFNYNKSKTEKKCSFINTKRFPIHINLFQQKAITWVNDGSQRWRWARFHFENEYNLRKKCLFLLSFFFIGLDWWCDPLYKHYMVNIKKKTNYKDEVLVLTFLCFIAQTLKLSFKLALFILFS